MFWPKQIGAAVKLAIKCLGHKKERARERKRKLLLVSHGFLSLILSPLFFVVVVAGCIDAAAASNFELEKSIRVSFFLSFSPIET